MTQLLASLLLEQAANNRHGITMLPQTAQLSYSDVPNLFHVGVPASTSEKWKSASGGVAYSQQDAQLAAIAESIERYTATVSPLPTKKISSIDPKQLITAESFSLFSDQQRATPNFPFHALYTDCPYTNVYDFFTNKECWAPHALVALRDDYATGVPTSSGLAAAETAHKALLRAIQELIERDGLMSTWLHSLPGRLIQTPTYITSQTKPLDARVYCFDLTPAYSPFPVIAVAGGIKKQGKWRYSLGVACREDAASATQKAYLEWCQGVFFAGIYPLYVDTSDITKNMQLRSFDQHAIYYTLHPKQWWGLPFFKDLRTLHTIQTPGRVMPVNQALKIVKEALHKAKIAIYYRPLTTVDSLQAGVHVVRAISPHLAPIFAHDQWPYVGGTVPNIAMRYPHITAKTTFPNTMPHPLG